MRRPSRTWLLISILVAVAAAGVIFANFALLGAATGDERVGNLSPRVVTTDTASDRTTVTSTEPTPEPATTTAPDSLPDNGPPTIDDRSGPSGGEETDHSGRGSRDDLPSEQSDDDRDD